MSRIQICALFVVTMCLVAARELAAADAGTAFTYQGELRDGGLLADGDCDFEFSLWDDPVGGVQLGVVLAQTVELVEGRLTVILDFGVNIFTGDAVWLQMDACCFTPCGPLLPLSPRQELTPTPYALAVPWGGLTGVPAGFADDVDDDTLDSLSCVNGEVAKWDGADWQCEEDTDTKYDGADFALSNQSCAAGDVVTGVSASGVVICAADDDTDTTYDGADFALSNQSCAAGDVVTGVSASGVVICAADVVGPADGHSLDAVDGAPIDAVFVDADGEVGIGTASPAELLHIFGDKPTLKIQGDENNEETGRLSLRQLNDSGFDVYYNGLSPAEQLVIEGFSSGVSNGTAVVIDNSTNHVGIGTTTPGQALDVVGNIHASGTIASGSSITIDGTAGSEKISSTADLELHVNDGRALRIETNAISPNIVGGHAANSVAAVFGATISGGGAAGEPNSVEGTFGTVGGGKDNTASGGNSTVSGGSVNTASGNDCTVGGGQENIAGSIRSTVGGGVVNAASGNTSTIGGGGFNTASGSSSTIAGGDQNTASNSRTTVGGGLLNTASGNLSTVGGGTSNTASGQVSTVPGGASNEAGGSYSFAAGRRAKANHAGAFVWADSADADCVSTAANEFRICAAGGVEVEGDLHTTGTITSGSSVTIDGTAGSERIISTDALELHTSSGRVFRVEPEASSVGLPAYAAPVIIGGWDGNMITPGVVGATISGGGADNGGVADEPNRVTDDWGTIGGGSNNVAGDDAGTTTDAINATVGGGFDNTAGGTGTVGGGQSNTASGLGATIGGGRENTSSAQDSTVAGGFGNTASADGATISGGQSNEASGSRSTVGGGENNTASGFRSTVGGGIGNIASGPDSTVGGGFNNESNTKASTVGGGVLNTASGFRSTVAGGHTNTASATQSTVGGGVLNTASDLYSTVAGGHTNTASGSYSTVPGGQDNVALGAYSFAAGRRAKANHHGAFVWADSNNADLATTADQQFLVRAAGGTTFYSNAGATTGVELAAGGGSWAGVSDRNLKENFTEVDTVAVMKRLASIPITTWNYKSQDDTIRHMGPMGQDFRAAYGIGEKETRITTIDADGVALAAIQGLHHIVEDKDAEIQRLQERLAQLEAVVAELVTSSRAHTVQGGAQ